MSHETATVLAFFAIYLACYFLPLIVAAVRGHRQTLAIGMLTLFAGWTVIGWLVALIWACTNPSPTTIVIHQDR